MMGALLAVLLIAGHVADAETTRRGLRHGLIEGNPAAQWIVRSPARMYAVKGAVATAQVVLFHKLAKNHPKLSRVLEVAVIGAYWGVAAHNWREYHRRAP